MEFQYNGDRKSDLTPEDVVVRKLLPRVERAYSHATEWVMSGTMPSQAAFGGCWQFEPGR